MPTLQQDRWKAAVLRPEKAAEAGRIVDRILANRARYEAVDAKTGVPWYVIAGLHNMESGGSFNCHLHEGSPLTARTRYVPKGRPLKGNPPFTWEESALDALLYDGMAAFDYSTLADTLYACEKYNGTGYLKYHPTVPTPYLWAGTSIGKPGKYTGDGHWDASARSGQIGICAIWKLMESRGILNFSKLS